VRLTASIPVLRVPDCPAARAFRCEGPAFGPAEAGGAPVRDVPSR